MEDMVEKVWEVKYQDQVHHQDQALLQEVQHQDQVHHQDQALLQEVQHQDQVHQEVLNQNQQ